MSGFRRPLRSAVRVKGDCFNRLSGASLSHLHIGDAGRKRTGNRVSPRCHARTIGLPSSRQELLPGSRTGIEAVFRNRHTLEGRFGLLRRLRRRDTFCRCDGTGHDLDVGSGGIAFRELGVEKLIGDPSAFARAMSEGDESLRTLFADVRLLYADGAYVLDGFVRGREGAPISIFGPCSSFSLLDGSRNGSSTSTSENQNVALTRNHILRHPLLPSAAAVVFTLRN